MQRVMVQIITIAQAVLFQWSSQQDSNANVKVLLALCDENNFNKHATILVNNATDRHQISA